MRIKTEPDCRALFHETIHRLAKLGETVTAHAIYPAHDLSADQIEVLEEALYAYNANATGKTDGKSLGFIAEHGSERIGGVAGYTWAGMAELLQVWVREDRRKQGVGRQLMQAAMGEARHRRCRVLFLATYDFQARGFYEALGFTCVAEIAGKPPGHCEFVMRFDL